jgi:nucleotide-binding universal stress UspA family protein
MQGIVVGVDTSTDSAEAVAWAAREAAIRHLDLTAVLIWGWIDQPRNQADEEAELDTFLARILGDAAPAVKREVVEGVPAEALLRVASDADLLVVGRRGRGGFARLLIGSVSDQCLRHAPCPIAVVHNQGAGNDPPRIVVGVDGSDGAGRALAWALEEGRRRDAVVQAVHGWSPPYVGGFPYTSAQLDPGLFEQHARQVLDEALDQADTSGLAQPVDRELTCATGASAVLRAARDADLVVVGSRGLGGFKGLLLGSVSTPVAHHAPCPVVVVPPPTPHG